MVLRLSFEALIPRYRSSRFGVLNCVGNITTTRGVSVPSASTLAVKLAGVLTHVRFSLNANNFDAGSISLYGRVAA
jgi:hypothetical protein